MSFWGFFGGAGGCLVFGFSRRGGGSINSWGEFFLFVLITEIVNAGKTIETTQILVIFLIKAEHNYIFYASYLLSVNNQPQKYERHFQILLRLKGTINILNI